MAPAGGTHRQLADSTLSEAARTDELLALSELKAAAKEQSVLLVLDDVWNAAHAGPLNLSTLPLRAPPCWSRRGSMA